MYQKEGIGFFCISKKTSGVKINFCVPRFEIPSATAKFVNFFEKWTLKESDTCSGESACPVSVAPQFNSSSPLNSTAVITVRASCRHWQKRRLFLCLENGTAGCWVSSSAIESNAHPESPESSYSMYDSYD